MTSASTSRAAAKDAVHAVHAGEEEQVESAESPADDGAKAGKDAYRPRSGDDVDIALASFLNQTRNRLRRVLFSRLHGGSYLYGTCRVVLRIGPGGRLEGIEEDSPSGNSIWAPIEELTRRVERFESSRLRRARQRAAAGAMGART